MRILIDEDEDEVAKALELILEKNNYSVDTVENVSKAFEYLLSENYDIAVLDIMMPYVDGIEVLKRIRSKGISLPVLLLTAKSEIEDRVVVLNAGADDYLTKPFATSEFLARIKALSRMVSSYTPNVIAFGNVILDCNTFNLSVCDKIVRLNNKEFQMMELFLRNQHKVFSAEQLMERIWGYDSESGIDVVWAYVAFLRKKLKLLGANIEIRTMRGAGYALEDN